MNIILDTITELDKKASLRNLKLKNFWTNFPKISLKKGDTASDTTATGTATSDTTATDSTATDAPVTDATSIVNVSKSVRMTEEAVENIPPTSFRKPAQNSIKQNIDLVNAELTGLYKRQSLGLLSLEQQKLIQKNEKQKTVLEKTLRNKIHYQKRQLKNRRKRKENLSKIIAAYPESASILKSRDRAGRPRVEDSQPELLKAIVDIATYGAGAHERRRSYIHRSIKSLDELWIFDEAFRSREVLSI